MKIAVWHNLPSGGGKRALHGHVRGLVERGHTVEAWCPATADQSYLPLGKIITEHVLPLAAVKRSRAQAVRRELTGGLDILDRVREMEAHSRLCAAQIEQGGFDALFACSCLWFASPFIGRYLSLPKVLYLQEPARFLYEAWPELPWIAPAPAARQAMRRSPALWYRDNRAVRALRVQAREELTNAQAFDTVLVNSHFSRESVRRVYGLNAHVCYLGIDTALFQGAELPREDFVLGVGAFDPRKDIGFVLDAIASLPEPRPRLVWVGNSKTPEYLDALTRQAAAAGVHFEPRLRVTDAEMTDLMRRASVMAYAPFLEPFGFAPLEANACGLPVVAVAEGGVRETVQDGVNGLLVDHAPQAMASAIDRLRRDSAYARTLGENGRRLVQSYWRMTDAVERLELRLRAASESGASRGPAPAPRTEQKQV